MKIEMKSDNPFDIKFDDIPDGTVFKTKHDHGIFMRIWTINVTEKNNAISIESGIPVSIAHDVVCKIIKGKFVEE